MPSLTKQPTELSQSLSQEELFLILENLSDAVLVFQPTGDIIWCNRAFSTIVDSSPQKLSTSNLGDLFERIEKEVLPHDENDKRGMAVKILESLHKGLSTSGELALKRRGQWHNFTIKATPILKDSVVVKGVIALHDVTQVRRTEKIRRDFVANVSHELRTPLSAINGYSETLLDGALEDSQTAHEFISTIHRHATRLSNLVQDLLDLSKLESDQPPDFSSVNITRLIQKVVSMNQHGLEDKNIACDVEIELDLPEVYGHESSVEQVINNYIENAIKYSNDGGQVKIKACLNPQSRLVQVDVSDTGIGIEAKHFPRLFERFYRVDKARSREFGGTGLGLSIVKHIVELHGGSVWVHSIHGQGSTFSFTLRPIKK